MRSAARPVPTEEGDGGAPALTGDRREALLNSEKTRRREKTAQKKSGKEVRSYRKIITELAHQPNGYRSYTATNT